jgi:hypothetical protein
MLRTRIGGFVANVLPVVVTLCVISAAYPAFVVAAPLFGTSANASACVDLCGFFRTKSATGALDASAQAVLANKFGAAHGFSTATIGGFSADSSAQAAFGAGNADATAGASFFDTLTVTGPRGEVARFLIGMTFSVAVLPGLDGGNAQVDVSVSANGLSSVFDEFATSLPGERPVITSTPPFILEVPVGQKILLSGSVSTAAVSVAPSLPPPTPLNPSSASDPMQVFIDPLILGDGIISASGITYPSGPTSVPEPSTLSLVALTLSLSFLLRQSVLTTICRVDRFLGPYFQRT